VKVVVHRRALLLWSASAIAGMVVLGLLVRNGSTPLDDWFRRLGPTPARHLLVFTDPYLLAFLLLVGLAVALYLRQWRLAAIVVASPLVGIVSARSLKALFGREIDGALAFPSGHTTAAVVVGGMLVLVAGGALWAVLAALAFVVLAMIGQAVTYHYFTDTVGALLLGSAVVSVAAVAAKLDRRQPGCDADHTGR
jgi:membrane-associated phospholipid phosphatase